VYTFGYFSDGDGSRDDATIVTDTYLHGNYDYATQSTRWDSFNADRILPPSLYLSSKPAFFGGLPWPSIGSDRNPLVGTIPAKERYEGRAIPPATGTLPPTDFRIVGRTETEQLLALAIFGTSSVPAGTRSREVLK
jgi:hypothetical protein